MSKSPRTQNGPLARNVRAVAAARGYSLGYVAQAAGMSRDALKRRLLDESKVTLGELEALGRVLGYDPSELTAETITISGVAA